MSTQGRWSGSRRYSLSPQAGSPSPAIERAEAEGTLKLDTLRRAADALDCDLLYVLVPRTSLDEAVHAQARRKAIEQLRRVAHNMRLENQNGDDADSQVDDLAADLIDRRGLWTDASP